MAEAMQPTRDVQATLPELVDVLLNKGVYLDLDLIITVADIPLIGVNLKATIAGMETMLEYGMMKNWDERTRAWIRHSVSRQVPLRPGEQVIAKMAGGHYWQDPNGTFDTWRPGSIFLTTHRIIAFRRDPQEILWQANLYDIEQVVLQSETSVGGEKRSRLLVEKHDGGTALLSAAQPHRMRDLVRQAQAGTVEIEASAGGPATRSQAERDGKEDAPDTLLFEGDVWFQEQRAGSPTWRGGTAKYDSEEGFSWKAALDRRPAVRLKAEEMTAVRAENGHTPVGNSSILILESEAETYRFASDRVEQWALLLHGVSQQEREVDDDTESQ
ncbi:gas vesicle protein [Arthrobacter monumenti]